MKPYRAIAAYYDAENRHHDMLRFDVPTLLRHFPKRPQSVLELATGTARAAIPIARAGHKVVGVDYAPDMLAVAKQKRDAAKIPAKNLTLIKADVLTLRLKKKFDWIVLLFNTFLAFPTLDQQDQLLQTVVRHLKPNGRFYVDIFNPNMAILARPRSDNLDPHIFHIPTLNRTVYRTATVMRDATAQLQRVTFNYQWFDDHGKEHYEKVPFTLTFMFPRELKILLERNGLKIETMYGDYSNSPLTNNSPRIIALCRHAKRP
jgi:ubiquinone/menaquinone biosynthesis C-methylase UbiE